MFHPATYLIPQRSRSRSAVARPTPRRASPVVLHAVDPASAEVVAALTAVTASTAAVLGLASIIRQANGFDKPSTLSHVQQLAKVPAVEDIMVAEENSVVAAAAATEPTSTDLSVAPEAEAQKVQSWISSWRVRTETADPPAAITMPFSGNDDVATTRVTEPSMPATASKSDPNAAAAVLEEMSADAPTGSTAPGQQTSPTETKTPNDLTPAGVFASPVSITSEDDPMTAAREYEERLTKVMSESATTAPSTDANRAPRVVVPDQYKEKIDSLWNSYETKRVQEAALLAKQEKLTMDLAALEAVQQAQTQQAPQVNVVVTAMRRAAHFIQTLWVIIMAFVARVTNGRIGSSSSSGAGASA